jgi:NADH:ubiquinone oxidoreductase subunit D
VYSYKTCIDFGLTGVMARSVGLKRDIRLSQLETYANYYHLNFRSYIGQRGDCYDRFLIRMNEMVESLFIITQVVNSLVFIGKTKKVNKRNNHIYTDINAHHLLNYVYPQLTNNSKSKTQYNSMDNLIDHFKY